MQTLAEQAWAAYGDAEYAQAQHLAEQALRRAAGDLYAECCLLLARARLGGDVKPALGRLRRLLRERPDLVFLHTSRAELLSIIGDIDGAVAGYETALALQPQAISAFFQLVQLRKYRQVDAVCQRMRQLYDDPKTPQEARMAIGFSLAKVYDDVGDVAEAMSICLAANQMRGQSFAPALSARRLASLQALQARGDFPRFASSGNPSDKPVFIVGMPRSGTTLVEMVLARHPQVRACGELLDIEKIERMIRHAAAARLGPDPDPTEALAAADPELLAREAEAMLARIDGQKGGKYRRFTDKMPSNALRIGLISRLFPNARIIHVRRNPLDCGLSNLFAFLNSAYPWATRMDWIGAYYRYQEAMTLLWRDITGIDALDVQYEDLVRDPEPQIRRIVAFVGLEWNEACLDPHRSAAQIGTTSVYQARQPINTGSVERWRRYEPWLGPMIEALGGYVALGVAPGATEPLPPL